MLNRNGGRSDSSYSLPPPHQPNAAANLQNYVSSQGDIPSEYSTNPKQLYANRNSCINPIATNDARSFMSSNIPLYSETYSVPQEFQETYRPSLSTVIPSESSLNSDASRFDGTDTSYSNMNAQPSGINPTLESSSPTPIPETFVEVLPSEITCPACILQVKQKEPA